MKSFLILAIAALPAMAQPVISAKSGTLSWTEGAVFLDGQAIETSATKFPDIKENSVLRTAAGRAEILLTPGSVMHIGENTSFRMITKRLIDTRLELLTGSAVLNIAEANKDTNITLVCKSGTVALARAGHYRFDTEPARVKVFAGQADVQVGDNHVEVGSGKMLDLSGQLATAEKFDKEDTDALDNWSRRRDEVIAMANVSSAKSVYNGYGFVGSGGAWTWNPYFGLYTYIPGTGRFCDPYYGFCYWSPATVNRVFYRPPVNVGYNNGFGGFAPSYPTMGATSTGYSGTMASSVSSSVASSPAAAASAGSAASTAGAASAGSVGHGSGGGGGRGH